jgi:hypothetical protein
MPGTRRHQRRGAGVPRPPRGAKAPGDVLHLDFDRQPTRRAARVACIFTPDCRARQRLSGRELRASTVHWMDAWLFLACQMPQHGCPPRKRLRLQQGSETTRRHFWICLTFDVRGGPPAGRPLDGGVSRHARQRRGLGQGFWRLEHCARLNLPDRHRTPADQRPQERTAHAPARMEARGSWLLLE